MQRKWLIRRKALGLGIGVLITALASGTAPTAAQTVSPLTSPLASPQAAPQTAPQAPPTEATLTAQLAEHTLLAGNATGALLGNRTAEFQAASNALNANTAKLANTLTQVYGTRTQNFTPLWLRHIQDYVKYTNGIKANDQAQKTQAASDLVQFSQDFGQFATTLDSRVPQTRVVEMMQMHVLGTLKVIDAQAANNFELAYSLAGNDVRHMKLMARQLLPASADAGTNMSNMNAAATGTPADLRSDLALLLTENAALNANASAALIGARLNEYVAITKALDVNASDLSKRLGTTYGGNASEVLNNLWREQNVRFAAYANALKNQDQPTQLQARINAQGQAQAWLNQMNVLNPNLAGTPVAATGTQIAQGQLALIEAQQAGNAATEYQLRAQAAQSVLTLANTLSQAIQQQFPTQNPANSNQAAAAQAVS
jgi:hypothetical protein